MDKQLRKFLDEADSVRLDATELNDVRTNIESFMSANPVSTEVDQRQEDMMDLQNMLQLGRNDISLNDEEKSEVRMRLAAFMRERDIPYPTRSFAEKVRDGLRGFFQSVIPRTAFITILCVIMGTGVTYAAEGTVPGDYLYGFKLYVVEPMTARFMFDESDQAEWETSRALRRLQEAEDLAARNQLTEETWQQIQGRFLTHMDHAQQRINELRANGDTAQADQLIRNLESSLKSRTSSMMSRFGTDDEGGTQIERVLRDVEQAANGVTRVEEGVEQRLEERLDEQRGDDAAAVIDTVSLKVDELRMAVSNRRGPDPARDKLVLAETTLGLARTQLNGGAFDLALDSARDAARLVDEGMALLRE